MRKNISELNHKWRITPDGDYVEIDIHNSNFHPGTTKHDSTKFAKIMHLNNGTPFIRHKKEIFLIIE